MSEVAMTLDAIVTRNARWCPGDLAVADRERTMTWGEFSAYVDGVRAALSAHGIGRGDRLAAIDRNSIEQIALGYALAGLGAVLIPVSWRWSAAEIAYVLDHSRPDALMTSTEFAATVEEAAGGTGSFRLAVCRDARAEGWLGWDEFSAARSTAPESRPESWDDPHMIMYTSGTTGRPKGAVLSHRRSVVDAGGAIAAFNVGRGERLLGYLPLFHTGGWDQLKLYFSMGGAVLVMDRFDPALAIELIERHRCTAMLGLPIVFQDLIESPAFAGADLSSIRRIMYASFDAANLFPYVTDAFAARGATAIELSHPYGLTEAGPFVCILRPEDAQAGAGSVGTPVPGVDVHLLDESGEPVGAGEVGEICIRSGALMDGYLDDPEATAEAFRGGLFHTGDMGRMENGFLYLVDRKKDMIRTGGENVYAKEVERVLVGHPDVAECAVIGRADPRYDERVVAAVVPVAGRDPDEEEIERHARGELAGFKVPREVHIVAELPKNGLGKVEKHVLKEQLEAVPG